MRRIKKIELEKEIITRDTCGVDFEEDKHNTFECMACHKDVCRGCIEEVQISFNPIYVFSSILRLCPHCFETLTLKRIKELNSNEE